MPAFTNVAAYGHAISVVTAALQSGSIKLYGPMNGGDPAEKDAKYLNDLIKSLAKNLQTD